MITKLERLRDIEVIEFDINNDPTELEAFTKYCGFVYHLAGVNRPENRKEYFEGNCGFTSALLSHLKNNKNKSPIVFSSSTQAELENPYGESKKAAEDLLFKYSGEMGVKTLVYRFPNVFGKWCRPNYNSAVATFCYNIARDLPVAVNDRNTVLNLVYIDDVTDELIRALDGRENYIGPFCEVNTAYTKTLGEIVDSIDSFKSSRRDMSVPDLSDSFTKKLYSTYLSCLPKEQFSYPLKMNEDSRGSFTEFIKTTERGQFSVNISKPGITKGNHWHHLKVEKFMVVSGIGVIRFRMIGTAEVIEYNVSGDKLEVVDIPAGYIHNIQNLGETDMVTVMWANESFNPELPDTYYLEV